MSIATELLALRDHDGLFHVEHVVEWASNHPNSALHQSLLWDNAQAGHQYRLWQIRRLVAIHIVDEDRNRQTVSLKIDRSRGGGYRWLDDVMEAPDLRAAALADALESYQRLKEKYDWLAELAEVHEAIERARQRPARRRRSETINEDRPAV